MLLAPSYPCPRTIAKLKLYLISIFSIAAFNVKELVSSTWASPRNLTTALPFLST
uniref:Uncharacterized protein n=1 Tax=Arundo donax TaxID=35708 RepID=A0A0A9BCS4_ARUDO